MQRSSNKIQFCPKNSKKPQKTKQITFQESKDYKANIFYQNLPNTVNNNNHYNLITHQKQLNIKTLAASEIPITNNYIQENIIEQNEEERLKYLISKNDDENITFINTLLRLKGKNNQNGNNTPHTYNNNFPGTPKSNGMMFKSDNDNKSYMKDIYDIYGSVSPKQQRIQSNNISFTSQMLHSTKMNSSQNTLTITAKDFTPRQRGNCFAFYQHKFFPSSSINKNSNTNTISFNRHKGLKTRDLIEITNRRKLMTESNSNIGELFIKKKGFIQKEMNVDDLRNVAFTPQLNKKSKQIYQKITNDNCDKGKKYINVLPKDENIYSRSGSSSRCWKSNSKSDIQNKKGFLMNIICNNENKNERYIKTQELNKEIENNFLPVDEKLFHSNEDLRKDLAVSQPKHKLDNHKQLKQKVNTNLKEINEEIKNNKKFTLHSIDTHNSLNYNSNTFSYLISENINDNLNNKCSVVNNNNVLSSNVHHIKPKQKLNEFSLTSDMNMKFTKTNTINSLDSESKKEEFDLVQESKLIKHNINDGVFTGIKNISKTKLTSSIDHHLGETKTNHYYSNNMKNFTPKIIRNEHNETDLNNNKFKIINNDNQKDLISEERTEKVEEMLTAQIDLFDDDDDEEEEEDTHSSPKNQLSNQKQQNQSSSIHQKQFKTNKQVYNINTNNLLFKQDNPQKSNLAHYVNSIEPIQEKNIEIDIDDLVNPSYIFNSPQKSVPPPKTPSPQKTLSRSFCLDQHTPNESSKEPNENENKVSSHQNDSQTINSNTISNNSNDNNNNNYFHKTTTKPNLNNLTNSQIKRKFKFEPKKAATRNSKTTRSSVINNNKNGGINSIIKTTPTHKKHSNPSYDNYFKNIFSQDQKEKSQNISSNNNINNKYHLSNISYSPNINKSVKYHHGKNLSAYQQNSYTPIIHEDKFLSIINTTENIAESIISTSSKRQAYKNLVHNRHKFNKSNTPTKNKLSSSSYNVNEIIKEQLKGQIDLQDKNKKTKYKNGTNVKQTKDQNIMNNIKANLHTLNVKENELVQSQSSLVMKMETNKELDNNF